MEHLHEERLRRGAAVQVLDVQVVLAARGQRVDVGQDGEHLRKLVLIDCNGVSVFVLLLPNA